MAWSNVSKPTSSVWSRVTFQGKEIYDAPDIQYDQSTTFYDAINQTAWTDVTKPTSSTWTKVSKPS